MARAFSRMFLALIAGAAGGALVSALRPGPGEGRPAAKRAVKKGMEMYEQARQTVGEWGETASDLVAEVREELKEERRTADGAEETRDEQVVPFETRPEAERKLG